MYFGSVRFYKHIILIIMALVVTGSVISCSVMAISNHNLKQVLKDNGLTADSKPDATPVMNTDPDAITREKMAQYYLSSFDYQSLYPQLYIENDFLYNEDLAKSVYLTFDDGPSSLTPQILDILKEKNIQATFFIIYNDSVESQALYKRMLNEGHTIGVHCTVHQYETLYQSPESYLNDFAQTATMLEQATGVKPELFRFPGGSINTYNKAAYQPISAEMVRRGYTFYDWNVSSDDATSTTTEAQIYNNVINGVHKYNKSIVLMHDAGNKFDTLSALPDIIDTLSSEGYSFYSLNKDVRPVTFNYVN